MPFYFWCARQLLRLIIPDTAQCETLKCEFLQACAMPFFSMACRTVVETLRLFEWGSAQMKLCM